MSDSEFNTRGKIFLTINYGAILFFAGCFGLCLSFMAERGGITQGNAFIAPIIGPWSQILPPNAHEMSVWPLKYTAYTIFLSLVLPITIGGSYCIHKRWLRYTATGVAVIALLFWVLSGLLKVVLELH